MFITALESIFADASSLEDRFEHCQKAGFDGLDLRDHAADAARARTLAEQHGLRIGMIYSALPLPLLSATVHQRAAALEILTGKIRNAAEAGALGVIIVPVFGPPRVRARYLNAVEEAEAVLVELLLGELEPVLAETGVYLAIEPLNRGETHLFTSPTQVVRFLTRAPLSGVKTMADVYHMDRESQDPSEEIANTGGLLGCVHLSGPDRTLPGPGPIDLAAIFATLSRQGYDGPLGFECRPEPLAAIKESVRYVRTLLAAL